MGGELHRERMVLRNIRLDDFICNAWNKAYVNERATAQRIVGKLSNIKTRIDRFNLDKKLLILTALNKRFCLIIYDNDTEKVQFAKLAKVFDYHVSAQKNYESDEARKELGVFLVNERQAAKQFFIGSYRFAEPIYKMAENGDVYKFVSEFQTPRVSISKTEQKERNWDVYGMLFDMIDRGYFMDEYMKAYNMEYGHFVMIAKLFRAEMPMTQEEVIKKHRLLWTSRSAPSKQKLNEIVEKGYVDETDYYADEDEGDESKKIKVYTLSGKGMMLYREVIEAMMKPTIE